MQGESRGPVEVGVAIGVGVGVGVEVEVNIEAAQLRVSQALADLGLAGRSVLVAVSGGVDSTVLAHALSRSADITKGVRMDLFVFGLLIVGLNFLGLLALGVGLLVPAPISMVAGAYVYRQLDAQTNTGAAGPAEGGTV